MKRVNKRTREKAIAGLFIALLLGLSFTVGPQASVAQEQAAKPGEMVILNVRVTGANQRALDDVPQEAFQVTEDGIPQKIALFSNKQIPLSYGLLVDSSGSLRSQFSKVIISAMRIVNSNTPDDQTFLIRFISSDKIQLVQDLTTEKRSLLIGLQGFYIEGGQSAVVDAVYVGAQKLATVKTDPDHLRRKSLVLVTDGEDRNSFYTREQLFEFLGSLDIQIYVVGLTAELDDRSKKKALELLTRLARDTGGRVFFPKSPAELDSISDEIIRDIRTQYVIGYVPSSTKPTNGFHKVQVTISNDPNQEKRIAVTRVGYTNAN